MVVSLSGSYDEVLVAATDGTLATDKRPLIRLNCSVITEQNGRRERGSAGGGARVGYEFSLMKRPAMPAGSVLRKKPYVKDS